MRRRERICRGLLGLLVLVLQGLVDLVVAGGRLGDHVEVGAAVRLLQVLVHLHLLLGLGRALGPVLQLPAGEHGVEDDAEEVDPRGDAEDGLPLGDELVPVLVVLGDLLRGDRADHACTVRKVNIYRVIKRIGPELLHF